MNDPVMNHTVDITVNDIFMTRRHLLSVLQSPFNTQANISVKNRSIGSYIMHGLRKVKSSNQAGLDFVLPEVLQCGRCFSSGHLAIEQYEALADLITSRRHQHSEQIPSGDDDLTVPNTDSGTDTDEHMKDDQQTNSGCVNNTGSGSKKRTKEIDGSEKHSKKRKKSSDNANNSKQNDTNNNNASDSETISNNNNASENNTWKVKLSKKWFKMDNTSNGTFEILQCSDPFYVESKLHRSLCRNGFEPEEYGWILFKDVVEDYYNRLEAAKDLRNRNKLAANRVLYSGFI